MTPFVATLTTLTTTQLTNDTMDVYAISRNALTYVLVVCTPLPRPISYLQWVKIIR